VLAGAGTAGTAQASADPLTVGEAAALKAEYVGSPPEGGGMVELTSGKWALADSAGEPIAEFTAAEHAAIMRRAYGVSVESGATGQGAASVSGMSEADVTASDAMHADLQGELAADSAQGVVDDVTTLSRAIGVLPSWDAVADALAGSNPVVLVGGAALVGVAIGSGIDELVGWPTLFSSSKAETIEEGCWEAYITDCKYHLHHPAHAKLANHFACNPGFEHDGTNFEPGGPGECIGFDWSSKVTAEGKQVFYPEHAFTEERACEITFIYSPVESCFGAGTSAEVKSDAVIPAEVGQYEYPDGDRMAGVLRSTEMHDQALPQKDLCELSEGVELPSGCPEVEAPKPVPTPIVPGTTRVGGPLETYIPHYCEEHKEAECAPEHGDAPDPTLPEIPAPEHDELTTHYVTRLEVLGFTDIEVRTRPEVDIDPSVGPNEVAGVVPDPGTRVEPASKVEVETNPADAPEPEGSGPLSPPTIPPVKWPHVGTPCTVFPFGVPCWLGEEFAGLVSASRAPVFHFEVDGDPLTIDTKAAEPALEIIRPVEAAVSVIGFVILMFSFAKGGGSTGGASGGSDPGEHD